MASAGQGGAGSLHLLIFPVLTVLSLGQELPLRLLVQIHFTRTRTHARVFEFFRIVSTLAHSTNTLNRSLRSTLPSLQSCSSGYMNVFKLQFSRNSTSYLEFTLTARVQFHVL